MRVRDYLEYIIIGKIIIYTLRQLYNNKILGLKKIYIRVFKLVIRR